MRGSRLKIGFVILIIVLAMSKFITPITTYAKEDTTVIKGDVYQFEEKAPYDFSSSVKSETAKAYGTLSVSGDIIETSDVDGVDGKRCADSSDFKRWEDLGYSLFRNQYF